MSADRMWAAKPDFLRKFLAYLLRCSLNLIWDFTACVTDIDGKAITKLYARYIAARTPKIPQFSTSIKFAIEIGRNHFNVLDVSIFSHHRLHAFDIYQKCTPLSPSIGLLTVSSPYHTTHNRSLSIHTRISHPSFNREVDNIKCIILEWNCISFL